jgi:hypothetical protein
VDEERGHEHELELEYEPLNRPTVFRGVCSCGWESHWVTAAGMVHAAHAAHFTPARGRRPAPGNAGRPPPW